MPAIRSLALAAASLALLAPPAAGDEWSRFRGPNGSGVTAGAELPADLDHTVWETPVPFGRSSPAVGESAIFLTAIEDGKLLTLAIDRVSGRELWRRELERDHVAELHRATDSATPTPVTDGTNVYAFFHEAGAVSYDATGKQRWQVPLGPFRNYYGIAASPVLAGDSLVLVCDQAQGSFLVALDAATGRERWRRARPARRESYTTPILIPGEDGRKLLLVAGSRWVDAYELATGDSAWTLGGLGTGPVSSPVTAGGLLFVNTIDHAPEPLPPFRELAAEHDADGDGELTRAELEGSWIYNNFGWVDVDGSGAVSEADWLSLGEEITNENWGLFGIRLPDAGSQAEVVWNHRQSIPYIPSPLVYDGVLYILKGNVLTSLDPATGKPHKRGRVKGVSGEVYASPVAADGKLWVGSLDGDLAVLAAGPDWRVLATRDLGEPIHATPAIAGDRLYVRTRGKLIGFGAPPKPTPAATGR